jgi:flagellar hook-length control protein FliK
MSIAIVSALPSSAPMLAPDAAAGEEDTSLLQDFGALLLGRLFALPEPALGAAQEAAANDGADDENVAADDSLGLLAVLAQASLEQRSATAPVEGDGGAAQESLAGVTNRETGAEDRVPAAVREMRDAREALDARNDSRTPDAGRMPAAKFAVSMDTTDTTTGKKVSFGESAGTPSATASVAANFHVRPNDAPPPTLSVPTPVRDRNWHDDFAQQVTWIATQRNQSAELKLNPPAMGHIEVSIRLDNEGSTAVATFVSGNAEVRESIEAALPKLREMLAGVGIELGQAQVGAESFPRGAGDGQRQKEGASPSGNELAILAPGREVLRAVVPPGVSGRGLVDTFV